LIYEDRYEEVQDNRFKLHLYPYTVENEDTKEINHVGATIQIIYPDEYPEQVPEINIHSLKGLNNQMISELKSKLDEIALECIGSPMVFNIASTAQEWLLEKNDEHVDSDSEGEEEEEEEARLSAYERMMKERQQKQNELLGLGRFHLDSTGTGTPVTIDNFIEWKQRFDEERRQVQEALKKQQLQLLLQSGKLLPKEENKLTGREWFEQKSRWFNDAITEDVEEEVDVDIDEDLFLEDDEVNEEEDDE
jgi:hypothetical protein